MADKKPEKKETSTEAVKKVDKKLPFFKRIGKWFRDMKSELKKVVWPTPKQTANNTAVCLVVMLADRKSTRLNSSHPTTSRMPSSA